MLRWIFLVLALALAALGSLTVVQSPDWAPWKLAVLAGEYGHWVAFAPLLLAALAWLSRGEKFAVAGVTVLGCAVAFGLLLKPVLEASLIAGELPGKLEKQLGHAELARRPFAVTALWAGGVEPVPVETLPYSGNLSLDLYRPPRADAKPPLPCVILVHGGGWDGGSRAEIAHFNHWLAGRGYAVAAIDYRLAPNFPWPAQRDDTLAAIAFLKNHARELGIDPTRLVLLGRSAGGQIAEAVGYTANDPAIRGVIALYAPSDMVFAYVNAREDDILKSPTLMRQYLGGTPETARENYASASALPRVHASTPPTLLLHGAIDSLVWYRHSVRLDAKLAEQHVPHVFVSLPWATHAFEYNLAGPGGQLTTFAVEWFLAVVTRPAGR
jgi:acetyl esterase/lipase